MKNRLDKLFKDSVLKHFLTNGGPDWIGLKVLIQDKSRKSILILSLIMALLTLGLIVSSLKPSITAFNVNKTQNKTSDIEGKQNVKEGGMACIQLQQNVNKNSCIILNPAINKLNSDIFNHHNISLNTKKDKMIAIKMEAFDIVTDDSTLRPQKEIKNQNDTLKKVNINKAGNKDSLALAFKPLKGGSNNKKDLRMRQFTQPRILSLYASFSPSFIHSKDVIIDDNKTNKRYSKLKSEGEQMKRALGFDFGIGFSPFRKVSFKTGIYYEKRIENVEYNFINNEIPVTNPDGVILSPDYIILSDSASEKIYYSGANSYAYFGVPIYVNCNVFQYGKFSLGVNLSGCYMKEIGMKGKTINRTHLELEDMSEVNSSQPKRIFNTGLGLDLGCLLTKNLIFSIIPEYKKQLNKNDHTSSPHQTTFKISLQYFIF